MSNEMTDELDFTGNAWEVLYRTVDNTRFGADDAELIFEAIEAHTKFLPFGEYLKRYIYEKTGMKDEFGSIPMEDYQQTIMDGFRETHTPASFSSKTARLPSLAKNWLTQTTVSRKVVFLLGFGLSMSVADVNNFLEKGIREQGINAKDPFEVICWYCYKNGYSYPKFESLLRVYIETDQASRDLSALYNEYTVNLHSAVRNLNSDAALINFIIKLKTPDNRSQISKSVYDCFVGLYQETREAVARFFNSIEEEAEDAGTGKPAAKKKFYTAEDISAYDVEKVLYSAVPRDRYDNMVSVRRSKLRDQFKGCRINRQKITDILNRKVEASRYDLITLSFFVFSQTEPGTYRNPQHRFMEFLKKINRKLEKCNLAPVYVGNPYEHFILMCILADDPMGTFADVCELAYDEQTD